MESNHLALSNWFTASRDFQVTPQFHALIKASELAIYYYLKSEINHLVTVLVVITPSNALVTRDRVTLLGSKR